MDKYLPDFKNCRQQQPAFCQAACPFHLDVGAFVEKIKRGAFNAAYTMYKNAVVFPEIACAICDQPCMEVCPLAPESINMPLLEKAVLDYATKKDPADYNLPAKDKHIAIIGAGPSGLACALRLATKKYKVTVFEKTGQRGGHLWGQIDPSILLTEIATQFQHEECNFIMNRMVVSLEDLSTNPRPFPGPSMGGGFMGSNPYSGFESGYNDYGQDPYDPQHLMAMRENQINQASHPSEDLAEEAEDKPFDAIYVATGAGGIDFGLARGNLDQPCYMMGETGVFAGGSLLGRSSTEALEDGIKMSTTIDNFLKTGNLIYTPDHPGTTMVLHPDRLVKSKAIKPSLNSFGTLSFTKEEAIAEAGRCLSCQCDGCLLYNDLLEYTGKWPIRIRDEVQATTLPGSSEVKATPAKRLISISTFDGRCSRVCPENIDLDGLIEEARKSMHRQGKLAWAFNEFWLRDMDFANGEKSSICLPSPVKKGKDCQFAFFPGCQLAASDPDLVYKTYTSLLQINQSTGLMASCCGIPAQWAGDQELVEQQISRIKEQWQSLGSPTLIMACPTCHHFFKENLAEIPMVFLYQYLDQHLDLSTLDDSGVGSGTWSVFDPCKTLDMDDLRKSVRNIAKAKGANLVPLGKQEAEPGCCSYGGQGSIADPDFAKFVINKRIEEGTHPYITYCINCRDCFRSEGKEAIHLLELLFGPSVNHRPTPSMRRENRILLKEKVMKELWKEEVQLEREGTSITLNISPELKEDLGKKRILESDVATIISTCHSRQNTVFNQAANTYSCYGQVGHMTLWAEYKYDGPDFTLVKAYTHRMKIELEAVWNGVKRQDDM